MNWFQNCMPVDCLVAQIQGLSEGPFLKIKGRAIKTNVTPLQAVLTL